jgi:hypothetical protein
LLRFARNDGVWRWAQLHILATLIARGLPVRLSLLESRGRRESRVPMTPAVVRTKVHTGDRRCAGTPGFPCAVVLTAYAAFSPEPNSSGLRRRWIGDRSKARSGPTISIGLTPATGARTARFCRPQLPSQVASTGSCAAGRNFSRKRLSAARLAHRSIAHGNRPATTFAPDAAASTATRTPRIVTTRTPLFMRRDEAKKTSISKKGKRNVFSARSGRPKSR